MCEECQSAYLFWAWSDRLDAFVSTCGGCGWEDSSSATQDETVLETLTEM